MERLPAYLRSNDAMVPYFINGKAGGSKSTLIKFNVDHHETTGLLASWAGTSGPHIVKHFFWNLSNPLPKITMGMIRTLVHGILERYPEPIPVVLPTVLEAIRLWGRIYVHGNAKIFESLIKRSSGSLKLCIFIDGIHEHDGNDYRDLCLLLLLLISANLKIIVSGCPSLSLRPY